MTWLYPLIQPFFSRIDPEIAHGLAIFALKNGLISDYPLLQNSRLEQTIWDLEFKNPVGLAAGFDKNAEVVNAMLSQGFGFVEAGTVTPKAQHGNSKPRVFRYGRERAVINRLGFNSAGIDVVLDNLPPRSQRIGPVGINLGKNRVSHDAIADYVSGVYAFANQADFLVINVSSPNTPGLRELQNRKHLEVLLDSVQAALLVVAPDNPPPLLLKVAPDLDEDRKRDIAMVAIDLNLDGLVATNTTIDRPIKFQSLHSNEVGGLSGVPLLNNSTSILSDFYRLCEGRVPLIGVGGVSSGADAYLKIRAGASLVQLYTALIFEGPSLIHRINDDLSLLLEKDGFANISDAIGADH
jgi:dihydroorotate dehydrogenase